MKLFKTDEELLRELEEKAKKADTRLARLNREKEALSKLEKLKREEEKVAALRKKNRGSVNDIVSFMENLGDSLGFNEEPKRRKR